MTSLQSGGSQRHALDMSQTTRPLPRLPRNWSRLCHETGLFLRSIGLGILVTTFQGFFTNNFLEPEQVAIRQNRVTALLRALIHALPLGLAIFEIVINWKGLYVGAIFDKQNYLQFVAKAHEILIQASIATIMLSYTRYQISSSNGIPFGAVLGAFQFLQVSYLWSVEFWSAIISNDFRPRKKSGFAVLILICITVAATAGPSSANLLIARQGIWPEKSMFLAVNATVQNIWPDRLDDEKVSSDCKKVNSSQIQSGGCPVAALYSSVYSSESYLASVMEESDNHTLQSLDVDTFVNLFEKMLLVANCVEGFKDQLCATTPHDVLLGGLIEDTNAHIQEEDSRALQSYHVLEKDYYQPYATAICVTDTVQNSSDQALLRFARLADTSSEAEGNRELVSVPGATKGQSTYDIPGNTSQFRVDWKNLPQETFATGIPGAIIVHPQSSSNLSYNITTCTLNAGWGSSSAFTDIYENIVRSHMTQLPSSWDLTLVFQDTYEHVFQSFPMFGSRSNFSYPQRHINISKSWIDFINPEFTRPDNASISFMSELMSLLPSQPQEHDFAWTLSMLLATALASTGNHLDAAVFEDRAEALKSCETCLVFEIENSIWGWRYTAQETTTKLAIAVMLTYCALALAHLIYSAISGVSSTAWDSVAELVALAMNSSPTETLQNTCAGIIGKSAYQTRVRVLKTNGKHLELVFGEVTDPNADISKLVMNEKYGGLAERKKDGDEPLKMEEQGDIEKRVKIKHD